MIGSQLAQFQITAKIGQGGMGEVYRATDTSLDRDVALKFLPEYLAEDVVAQKRFIREARSAAAIDHPYICKIYEVGEAEGRSFIAMEYVEGQTLQKKLREGHLTLKETIRIGSDIASALEKAHNAGIVHRDLKPENIMLTEEGHVKVMDFGLAKRVEREEEEITAALTREGTTLGTLNYMSPEQLKGQPVDGRSDIFSFGVLLYEMLTGVHPFRTGTQAETINSILNENPSPVSLYTEEAPDLLQHTLEKMLAKDKEERYQSIREVATNLKKLLESLSVSATMAQPSRPGQVKWALIAAVMVMLAVAAIYWVGPSWQRLTFDAEARSVAILPLANISEDPDYSDHLAKGISQDVIEKLGQIGLKVTPWQTVQRFASSIEEPQEIAQQLQVKNVLHGSFEDQEEQIVVSLTLKETQRGLFYWVEEFREPYENLFRLEQRIATRIATSLKGELTTEEKATLALSRSRSPDAYEKYLEGAHILQETGEEATRLALEYFTEAVKLDPELVPAHIGLGGVQRDLYFYGWGGLDALNLAEASFEAALQLDPTSLRARRALIVYQSLFRGRSQEGLREWQRASQYGRLGDPESLLTRASAYTWSPETREAETLLRRVIDLEPLNEEAHVYLTAALWPLESEEVIEVGNTTLAKFGDSTNTIHAGIAMAHQLLKNYNEALEHYEKSIKQSWVRPDALIYQGILLDYLGDREAAEAVWRTGIELAQPRLSEHPDNVRLGVCLAGYHGLLHERESFLAREKRALAYGLNEAHLYVLATVHIYLGDAERGIEILRKIVSSGRLQSGWNAAAFRLAMQEPPETEAYQKLVHEYEIQAQQIRELY